MHQLPPPADRPRSPERRTPLLQVLLVVLVAFVARLVPVLRGGGLDGYLGYDEGVYYTGAAALLAGRLPYQDFTLLHPPGILLAVLPFAGVGQLTEDHVGLALARLGFMALGAVNAGLVAALGGRVLRPHTRWSALGAGGAGLVYALWYSAIYATRAPLLEGLGTTALLIALFLLWRSDRAVSDLARLLAGAALGAGVSTKIWGVVPLAVVAVWVWRADGWRAAGRLLAGAGGAVVMLCGPFLVLAPRAMVRMVLLDQVGRSPSNRSPISRGADAMSLSWNLPGLPVPVVAVLLLVVGAGVLAMTVVAWRTGSARLPAALLLVLSALLVLSPSYFTHYGELVAAPLALVVGAAAVAWQRTAPADGPIGRRRAVAAVALVVVVELPTVLRPIGQRLDPEPLRGKVADARCVATETPSLLALTDSLSRSLANGCRVPVDLTGATYDVAEEIAPDGRAMPRTQNERWQRYLQQYLFSADALLLYVRPANLLDGAGGARLTTRPVVARAGPVRLHRARAA